VKGAGGTYGVLEYNGHETDPREWAKNNNVPGNSIFAYSGKNSQTYGMYYLDQNKSHAWRI